MGSYNSKDESPNAEDSPLNEETLVQIFEYVESLNDLTKVARVSRWWATVLGSKVVPSVLGRLGLKAWYHEDSIKAFKAPGASGGGGAPVEACSSWQASPKGAAHLLDAFSFPSTLRAKVPPPPASELTSLAVWRAVAARGGEPRVVTTQAGRRALQFVDSLGRHPVHLRTAVFPEPLRQPVTVMVVGIAFEDATYVSGIHDRFEVCHAYPPPNQPDHERAPVSMTAHPVGDSSDSDEDPSPSCIVSGSTQPGSWHVYTAVFNGECSEIFVDGLREGGGPTLLPSEASSTPGAGAGAGHSNVGSGCLDGLTIGADHRNDFPLGSMFEGTIPGAISELVVFGSVLPEADRQAVERSLMKRHGIALPSADRERERRLVAQAHAMVSERAPGRRWEPCPLRFLARCNDVSWSIAHPVTGEKIRPKRIGVRETAESSGWDD